MANTPSRLPGTQPRTTLSADNPFDGVPAGALQCRMLDHNTIVIDAYGKPHRAGELLKIIDDKEQQARNRQLFADSVYVFSDPMLDDLPYISAQIQATLNVRATLIYSAIHKCDDKEKFERLRQELTAAVTASKNIDEVMEEVTAFATSHPPLPESTSITHLNMLRTHVASILPQYDPELRELLNRRSNVMMVMPDSAPWESSTEKPLLLPDVQISHINFETLESFFRNAPHHLTQAPAEGGVINVENPYFDTMHTTLLGIGLANADLLDVMDVGNDEHGTLAQEAFQEAISNSRLCGTDDPAIYAGAFEKNELLLHLYSVHRVSGFNVLERNVDGENKIPKLKELFEKMDAAIKASIKEQHTAATLPSLDTVRGLEDDRLGMMELMRIINRRRNGRNSKQDPDLELPDIASMGAYESLSIRNLPSVGSTARPIGRPKMFGPEVVIPDDEKVFTVAPHVPRSSGDFFVALNGLVTALGVTPKEFDREFGKQGMEYVNAIAYMVTKKHNEVMKLPKPEGVPESSMTEAMIPEFTYKTSTDQAKVAKVIETTSAAELTRYGQKAAADLTGQIIHFLLPFTFLPSPAQCASTGAPEASTYDRTLAATLFKRLEKESPGAYASNENQLSLHRYAAGLNCSLRNLGSQAGTLRTVVNINDFKLDGTITAKDFFRSTLHHTARHFAAKRGLSEDTLKPLLDALDAGLSEGMSPRKSYVVLEAATPPPAAPAKTGPYKPVLGKMLLDANGALMLEARSAARLAVEKPDEKPPASKVSAQASVFLQETKKLGALLDISDLKQEAIGNVLMASPVIACMEAQLAEPTQRKVWQQTINPDNPDYLTARKLARAIIEDGEDSLLTGLSTEKRAALKEALVMSPLLLSCMSGSAGVVKHVAGKYDELLSDYITASDELGMSPEEAKAEVYEPVAKLLTRDDAEAILPKHVITAPPLTSRIAEANSASARPVPLSLDAGAGLDADQFSKFLAGIGAAGVVANTVAAPTSDSASPALSVVADATPPAVPAPADSNEKPNPVAAAAAPRKASHGIPAVAVPADNGLDAEEVRAMRIRAMEATLGRIAEDIGKKIPGLSNLTHYAYCSIKNKTLTITFTDRSVSDSPTGTKVNLTYDLSKPFVKRGFGDDVPGLAIDTKAMKEIEQSVRGMLYAEHRFIPVHHEIRTRDSVPVLTMSDPVPPAMGVEAERKMKAVDCGGKYCLEIEAKYPQRNRDIPQPAHRLVIPMGLNVLTDEQAAAIPGADAQKILTHQTFSAGDLAALATSSNPRAAEMARRVGVVLQMLDRPVEQGNARSRIITKSDVVEALRQNVEQQPLGSLGNKWERGIRVNLEFDSANQLQPLDPEAEEARRSFVLELPATFHPNTPLPERSLTLSAPTLELDTGRKYGTWRLNFSLSYNPDVEKFSNTSGVPVYSRDVDLGTTDYDLALKRTKVMLSGDEKHYGLTEQLGNYFQQHPDAEVLLKRIRKLQFDKEDDKLDDYKVYPNLAKAEGHLAEEATEEAGIKKAVTKLKQKLVKQDIATDALSPLKSQRVAVKDYDFGHDEMQQFVRNHAPRFEQDIVVRYEYPKTAENGIIPVTFTMLRGCEDKPGTAYDKAEPLYNKVGDPVKIQIPFPEAQSDKLEAFANHAAARGMEKVRRHYASVQVPENPELKTPEAVLAHFNAIDTQGNRKDLNTPDLLAKDFPNLELDAPGGWLKKAVEDCAREAGITVGAKRTGGGGGGGKKPGAATKKNFVLDLPNEMVNGPDGLEVMPTALSRKLH